MKSRRDCVTPKVLNSYVVHFQTKIQLESLLGMTLFSQQYRMLRVFEKLKVTWKLMTSLP